MRKYIMILFLILLCTCSRSSDKGIKVIGRVVGFDNKPLPTVYMGIKGKGFKKYKYLEKNGNFDFRLDNIGGYFVWVNAPYHNTISFPLLINKNGNTEINIKLQAGDFSSISDSIKITEDYNNFSDDMKYSYMKKQTDGTFTIKVKTPADTFAYKILGALSDKRSMEGTQADYFIRHRKNAMIDGKSGYFISVIKSPGDSAVITFNPNFLPKSEEELSIIFGEKKSSAQRIVEFNNEIKKRNRIFWKKYEKYQSQDNDAKKFDFNRPDDLAYIFELYNKEQEDIIKEYLLLNYFHISRNPTDSLLARRVFSEISPSSLSWSLEWPDPLNTFSRISRLANLPEKEIEYSNLVVNEHSDPEICASFLFHLLSKAHFKKDTVKANEFYDRLLSEFGETNSAKRAEMYYSPNKKILVSKFIPNFSIPSLDDNNVIINNDFLSGKTILIDFWATWCGPCKAEMKNLHKIFEKNKAKNFTIFSLSLDRSKKDIEKYRKNEWPMPWLHAFIKDGMQSKIVKDFEVVGIPKPILIDSKGRILAVGGSLRGENLEKIVSFHLK